MVKITPNDVGRRVSVRSRVPAREGKPSLTDAVGVLLSWEAGRLRIRRRDGSVAEVAERDVVAARPVPPPPRRR